jgi:hypothetical protein
VACGLWLVAFWLFFSFLPKFDLPVLNASKEDVIHSIAMLPEFVEQRTSTCSFSNGVKTALPTPLYSVVVPKVPRWL